MRNSHYTAETIHTYLAPVAKGLGVSLKDINKPKRTVGAQIKGKYYDANKRGKQETKMDKYKRVVDFQRMVGIRREELSHLKREEPPVVATTGGSCVST